MSRPTSVISQMIAEAAVGQDIILPYDSVADTPAKCRALLEQAGFEATDVKTEVAFLDERLDHPAWRALKESSQKTRDAIREAFITSITKNATANRVPNKVAQNFAYGRKP